MSEPRGNAVDFSMSLDSAREEVERALLAAGIAPSAIARIHRNFKSKHSWQESALRIIELNVFGFLYDGNYFGHDTPEARKRISSYIRSHARSFEAAKNKYGIEAESIAALLWVETKLGRQTGSIPLPWVYYALSLASHPRFCAEMMTILPDKLEKSRLSGKPDLATAQRKLLARCRSKSEWAIEELRTVFELEKTHDLKPFQIKASFAGAFGIPQFLPSSYRKYAVSDYRKKPDLFMTSDAILSVGNFLHQNGWKRDVPDSQPVALYAYNRSRDYGAVILRIAEGMKSKTSL